MGSHPRGELEEQATERRRKYGQAHNDSFLPPYCPRRYGNMVKMRVRNANDLTNIAFELTKILKKKGGSTPPTTCAVQRSPEEGAARRRDRAMVEAAKQVLAALNDLEVDENATMWRGVIKFAGEPKKWRQGTCWAILETERQLVWGKISDALGSKL